MQCGAPNHNISQIKSQFLVQWQKENFILICDYPRVHLLSSALCTVTIECVNQQTFQALNELMQKSRKMILWPLCWSFSSQLLIYGSLLANESTWSVVLKEPFRLQACKIPMGMRCVHQSRELWSFLKKLYLRHPQNLCSSVWRNEAVFTDMLSYTADQIFCIDIQENVITARTVHMENSSSLA